MADDAPETFAVPNYPSQEVKEFGERISGAMFDASIRYSMAGLGGCKEFQIEDLDEDIRIYIMACLEGNLDSVAITYAAMRTKEKQIMACDEHKNKGDEQ